MIETAPKVESSPTESNAGNGSRVQFVLLIVAILAVILNRAYIRNIRLDWLNIIPLIATLYIGYAVVAIGKVCGHVPYVARSISNDLEHKEAVRRVFVFSVVSLHDGATNSAGSGRVRTSLRKLRSSALVRTPRRFAIHSRFQIRNTLRRSR